MCAYAEGLFVFERYICDSEAPFWSTTRFPSMGPQKQQSNHHLYTCNLCLFREYFCWDCLTIYEGETIHPIIPLQRCLGSLIRCSTQRAERCWAACPLGLQSLPTAPYVLALRDLSLSVCCLLNGVWGSSGSSVQCLAQEFLSQDFCSCGVSTGSHKCMMIQV